MIKVGKSFSLLAMSICALGGSVALSAASGEASAVPSADAFSPIERYGITYDKPRDIAEFYLQRFGLHRNDADLLEVKHPTDRSMRVLIVTVEGLADASVQAAQWRLGVKFSEGQWQAVEAGMRRKCVRGENSGQWTKDVCP